MSKNNKKTMNERTHNSMEIYKNNNNSNSNNNNLKEEFSTEFDSTKAKNNVTNNNPQSTKNK